MLIGLLMQLDKNVEILLICFDVSNCLLLVSLLISL
jgi:hypothetical protein